MREVSLKDKSNRIFCASLLQDLLDKKITEQDVIDKWPKQTGDSILDNIYCLLFHYRDDEDIRMKDSRYAIWQEDEIKKHIKLLLSEEKW